MKEIVCLLTGLTDVSLDDLGGKTPLEKANVATLDLLAQQGSCIRMPTPNHGGAETALLDLLGVSKGLDRAAKGPLVAMAMGCVLESDEAAYLIRFCSAGQGIIVDIADDLVSDSEGRALCEALTSRALRFIHVAGPEALLVTSDPSLHHPKSSQPLGPAQLVGRPWQKLLPKGVHKKTALRLLEPLIETLTYHEVNQVRAELEEPPINALVLTDGGRSPQFHRPKGVPTLLFTRDKVFEGVAKALDLPLWQPPPTLAKFGDVPTLLKHLDGAMEGYDRLLIDLPYLMSSTYRGDLLEKVKTIEWLDRNFLAPLKQWCLLHNVKLTVRPLRHTDIRLGTVTKGAVPAVTYPGDAPLPSYSEPAFKQAPLSFT